MTYVNLPTYGWIWIRDARRAPGVARRHLDGISQTGHIERNAADVAGTDTSEALKLDEDRGGVKWQPQKSRKHNVTLHQLGGADRWCWPAIR